MLILFLDVYLGDLSLLIPYNLEKNSPSSFSDFPYSITISNNAFHRFFLHLLFTMLR